MKFLAEFLSIVLCLTLSFSATSQETGLANVFSDDFDGSWTASNERYDKALFSAAHKSYEFGTFLNVTRLDNGKKIKVRVIDRGPFMAGYVVTLSDKAAKHLGIDKEARVTISVARDDDKSTIVSQKPVITNIEAGQVPTHKPTKAITSANTTVPSQVIVQTPIKQAPAAPVYREPIVQKQEFVSKGAEGMQRLNSANFRSHDLYKVSIHKPKKAGYGLQIGIYSTYENAMKEIARMQGNNFDNVLMSMEKGKTAKTTAYKILLGPFYTKDSASSFQSNVLKTKGINSFMVDLGTIAY